MRRNAEQRQYHAAKEREYHAQRMAERAEAVRSLRAAASTLQAHGYSRGMLVDVIDGKLGESLQGLARRG